MVCGLILSFRSRPDPRALAVAGYRLCGLYAAIGLVPLEDRLALWILPAAYASIALAVDGSLDLGRQAIMRRTVPAVVLAVAAAVLVWPLTTNIVKEGRYSLTLRAADNHGLNDRAGTRFLIVQHRPGDVLIANHFGLPALWWYGGISIADPNRGGRYGDAAPVFELTHEWPGPACGRIDGQTQPQRALAGARRAGPFSGIRFPDSSRSAGAGAEYLQRILDGS